MVGNIRKSFASLAVRVTRLAAFCHHLLLEISQADEECEPQQHPDELTLTIPPWFHPSVGSKWSTPKLIGVPWCPMHGAPRCPTVSQSQKKKPFVGWFSTPAWNLHLRHVRMTGGSSQIDFRTINAALRSTMSLKCRSLFSKPCTCAGHTWAALIIASHSQDDRSSSAWSYLDLPGMQNYRTKLELLFFGRLEIFLSLSL